MLDDETTPCFSRDWEKQGVERLKQENPMPPGLLPL